MNLLACNITTWDIRNVLLCGINESTYHEYFLHVTRNVCVQFCHSVLAFMHSHGYKYDKINSTSIIYISPGKVMCNASNYYPILKALCNLTTVLSLKLK